MISFAKKPFLALMRTSTKFFFFCVYSIVKVIIWFGEFVKSIILFPVKSVLLLKKFFNEVNPFVFINLIQNFIKWLYVIIVKIVIYSFIFLKIVIQQCIYFIHNLLKIFVWILLLPYRLFISLFSMKFRFFVFGFIVCLIVLFINQLYLFVTDLPSPRNIGKVNFSQSSHLFDRNGRLLYEIYRYENRTKVDMQIFPKYIKQSTIAIEDKDFFQHNGISFFSGIMRAIKENLSAKSLQGGSTITQQLVKSALLTPERTIQRKIKEIILALWTEKLYTKQEILEMYLNQVPYGGSSYGIEEASKTYFNKSAKDLTLPEAALLAGLPQAPSLYSPYVNPDLATSRRNEVLKKMREQGYISEKEKKDAQASPLVVNPLKTTIKAPHFVFYVKSKLEEEYGIQQVEEGGLKVTTTLDLDIQEEAEKIVKEELEKVKSLNVGNGALLVTRPATGEILAMVGSADYFASPSGAFNVTTALRQPGSSIKPIMYALSLEKGFTAASVIDDSPIVFSIAGSQPYKPVNYDGRFHGKVPLRYALANSYNIPAVRVLNSIGVTNFVNFAKKLGISTWTDTSRFGLSLTLGGGEVYMTDMATAFGVFANSGDKVNITSVLRIEKNNNEMYNLEPHRIKVQNSENAFIISDILSDSFARRIAFGSNSALEIPGYKVAVKTGTTDEKKDNWTIGYTTDFLVTVWVGNNDNIPMNPYLASGVTGAAPIWNRMMTYLLTKYGNNTGFIKPETIVEKQCYYGRVEYFAQGTENKVSCKEYLFGVSPSPTIAH